MKSGKQIKNNIMILAQVIAKKSKNWFDCDIIFLSYNYYL